MKAETENQITGPKKPVPQLDKSERSKCEKCGGPERCNQQQKPEIFVGCSNCQRNGKS